MSGRKKKDCQYRKVEIKRGKNKERRECDSKLDINKIRKIIKDNNVLIMRCDEEIPLQYIYDISINEDTAMITVLGEKFTHTLREYMKEYYDTKNISFLIDFYTYLYKLIHGLNIMMNESIYYNGLDDIKLNVDIGNIAIIISNLDGEARPVKELWSVIRKDLLALFSNYPMPDIESILLKKERQSSMDVLEEIIEMEIKHLEIFNDITL